METIAPTFVAWWAGVAMILVAATARAVRRSERFEIEEVTRILLVGIAAGLALFLVPEGLDTITTTNDFIVRFFAALAIAWFVTMRTVDIPGRSGGSGLALAAFAGVNVPPIALMMSISMVCGGNSVCF